MDVVGKYSYRMQSSNRQMEVPVVVDVALVGRTKVIACLREFTGLSKQCTQREPQMASRFSLLLCSGRAHPQRPVRSQLDGPEDPLQAALAKPLFGDAGELSYGDTLVHFGRGDFLLCRGCIAL